MKKVTLLGSLLVAGAMTFTGVNGTAQADEVEEEGAKTVWGEVLPAEADPDGDGWANTGFDPTWMSQEGQDRISELADEKDTGMISQVEFNEAVAEIFQHEQQMNMQHEKMADSHMSMDEAHLAHLAMNEPEMLDAAPIHEEPYNYNFVYGNHGFHFSYDGAYWTWSYDELKTDFTDEELMYLAHHDPEVLNHHPVKAGMYNFKLWDNHYVYHFESDGKHWTWAYEPK